MEQKLTALTEDQFQANRFDIVSRLADDLAHEIKNPLNAIIINLEVLKVRITRGDAHGAGGRVAVIEEEVRRLHQLIDRLLLLIRPERVEASNLPVDSAFDEILPLIAAQARLARNQFTADCAAAVFVPVRRDVFKFAMLNLLTAAHARLGEGGGTLAVRCITENSHLTVVIDVMPDEGAVLIAVADAGQALEVAGALLQPAGGQIVEEANRVTVRLPRAAAV